MEEKLNDNPYCPNKLVSLFFSGFRIMTTRVIKIEMGVCTLEIAKNMIIMLTLYAKIPEDWYNRFCVARPAYAFSPNPC